MKQLYEAGKVFGRAVPSQPLKGLVHEMPVPVVQLPLKGGLYLQVCDTGRFLKIIFFSVKAETDVLDKHISDNWATLLPGREPDRSKAAVWPLRGSSRIAQNQPDSSEAAAWPLWRVPP